MSTAALPMTNDERQLLSYRATLRSEGYLLLRNVVRWDAFDTFEAYLLRELRKGVRRDRARYGAAISTIQQPLVAKMLANKRYLRENLYELVKVSDQLGGFADLVTSSIAEIFPLGEVLFRLTRCRMDLPMDTREYALWHQDAYYTKQPDALTIWVPLQDTFHELGPLKVMPRTHRIGKLDHLKSLSSKRFYVPCANHSAEVRYVSMSKGDALLFDAHLLHSGSLNHSSQVRFSVQIRCERFSTL